MARGIGMALAQMPAMTAAYASVAAAEMGDVTTRVNIVQHLGGAVGAICVVLTFVQSGDGARAYAWAFALLAAISALALVSAMAAVRQPHLTGPPLRPPPPDHWCMWLRKA